MESADRSHLVYRIGRAAATGTRLGRRRLAACCGLSEMSVRLELERLRDAGWATLDRSGVDLTAAGRRRFASLLDRIRDVRAVELTTLRLDACALAGLVAAPERAAAWEVRDLAVRQGATGLLLLRFAAQEWTFSHDDEPIVERNPDDALVLIDAFPEAVVGDRLVVAFAPDMASATLALWHVLGEFADG